MHYEYKTKGTCSVVISFDIDDDIITNVKFTGGCPGNTKGVAALVDGQTVDYIESKLKGITCGPRPTSCPDQLAIAVREAYNSLHNN